jgi:hypothetical protein
MRDAVHVLQTNRKAWLYIPLLTGPGGVLGFHQRARTAIVSRAELAEVDHDVLEAAAGIADETGTSHQRDPDRRRVSNAFADRVLILSP